jgi:hypothetical protein
MRKALLIASLLGLLVGAPLQAPAAGAPESTGVIERYDSVRNVAFIGGVEYWLDAEPAAALAEYRQQHGPGSLAGKNIAFHSYRDKDGRPRIDAIAY